MPLHELERTVLNGHRERERLLVVIVDVLERVGDLLALGSANLAAGDLTGSANALSSACEVFD